MFIVKKRYKAEIANVEKVIKTVDMGQAKLSLQWKLFFSNSF